MIGGRVLDASFAASLVRGGLASAAWLDAALELPLALYLSSLAVTEVRAVRPDAEPDLAELVGHPAVVAAELDADTATRVDRLLDQAGMFDALAGQVVQVARSRGWPVLSADPGRLRRLDPNLEIDALSLLRPEKVVGLARLPG